MKPITWHMNLHKTAAPLSPAIATVQEIKRAAHFHLTIPGYAPTPLYSLQALAKHLNVGEILVKDESQRFGLNSFKVLGSSYAVASHLDSSRQPPSFLDLKEKMKSLPPQIFATATDGNHGLGLAWTARELGAEAIVYMPKGSSTYRLSKIRELGATSSITDMNYDDTVLYAAKTAKEKGWLLFQDTSLDGYVAIPKRIMQGYLTIVDECMSVFTTPPTHVILQAGVGSLAGAIVEGLQQLMGSSTTFIIVEPTNADCLFQSGSSSDDTLKCASGDLSTVMAGLSCGKPNPIAWDILKKSVDCFVTCPDDVAAKGMRILGNPLDKDPRIISGESGAVPLGLLYEICTNPLLSNFKDMLKLDKHSRLFLINTEGDTDPESYRSICWDGMYSPH